MKQPAWILLTFLAASLLFNAVLLFRHGNERPAKADLLPAPSRSEPEGGAEWPPQTSKAPPAPQESMLDSVELGIEEQLAMEGAVVEADGAGRSAGAIELVGLAVGVDDA